MEQDNRNINEKEITDSGNKKPNLFRILTGLFILGFLVCTALIIRNIVVQRRAEAFYEQLAEEVNSAGADSATAVNADNESVKPQPVPTEIPCANEPTDKPSDDTASDETNTEETGETDTASAEITESTDAEGSPYDNIHTLDQSHKSLDWDKLKAYNPDIYAWIYIPNTRVDYPVLQSETDNAYYLKHNIDGSKGYPGCIYTENYNSKDFNDPCTVIYGHNMSTTGTMFRSTHFFEDLAFFENNRYVYIYTPDETITYEVYACVVRDNAHILKKYDFSKMTGIYKFIKEVDSCRGMTDHIRSDMSISYEDKLLVLSTCIDTDDNKRFNLVCVKR